MIDWKLVGDIFLCLSIILSGATFVYANVNYVPENEEEDDAGR